MSAHIDAVARARSRCTHHARAMIALIIASVLTAVLMAMPTARRAGAQSSGASITGTVRAAAGAPLPNATVLAADSTGALVAGATTSDDGRFTLTLRRAGTYRVTTRRVGFAPDSSTLRVRAGERATLDATLTPFAVRLTDVVVADAKRCAISPQSGAAAMRLWEETQSALAATVAAEATPRAFTLERFEREMDPERGIVRRESRWRTVAATSEPYYSISAESLAVHGFVVPAGDSLVYYAPDARTLISDAFARGHCFRPVRDPAHAELVGLAFSPAPSVRGTRVDVTGTLWLDAETAQLQRLAFSFTPTERARVEVEGSQSPVATGEVVYRRAPDSTWIVDRWMIRMPILTYRVVLAPESGTSLASGTLVSRHYVASVRSVLETGGSVVSVSSSAMAPPVISHSGVVSGRFTDTTRTPVSVAPSLAGIVVTLEADGRVWRTTRTDAAGGFRMDSVAPGTYVLRASGGILDTLDAQLPVRSLDVRAGSELTFVATLPSRASSLARLCGVSMSKNMGAIHGIVRDAATGAPVAGATVRADWFAISDPSTDRFRARVSDRIATTDSTGAYTLCQLPLVHAFAVSARRGTVVGPVVDVPRSDERLRFVALDLGAPASPR